MRVMEKEVVVEAGFSSNPLPLRRHTVKLHVSPLALEKGHVTGSCPWNVLHAVLRLGLVGDDGGVTGWKEPGSLDDCVSEAL